MAAKDTDSIITIATRCKLPLLKQPTRHVSSKVHNMAWLEHIQLSQYFLDSLPEGSNEDEADWDIYIHEAVPRIQQAVRDLIHTCSKAEVKRAAEMPDGLSWNVLRLGPCGNSFPFTLMIHFDDDTVQRQSRIKTRNEDLLSLPDEMRVHYSIGPGSTFAYAVTVSTVKKLLAYPIDTVAFSFQPSSACQTDYAASQSTTRSFFTKKHMVEPAPVKVK